MVNPCPAHNNAAYNGSTDRGKPSDDMNNDLLRVLALVEDERHLVAYDLFRDVRNRVEFAEALNRQDMEEKARKSSIHKYAPITGSLRLPPSSSMIRDRGNLILPRFSFSSQKASSVLIDTATNSTQNIHRIDSESTRISKINNPILSDATGSHIDSTCISSSSSFGTITSCSPSFSTSESFDGEAPPTPTRDPLEKSSSRMSIFKSALGPSHKKTTKPPIKRVLSENESQIKKELETSAMLVKKARHLLDANWKEFKSLEKRARLFNKAKEHHANEIDWTQHQNKFGVATYYRQEEDKSLSIKLEGGCLMGVPVLYQMAILREIDLFNTWSPFCSKSKMLKRRGKIEALGWLNIKVPLLGLNRDLTYRVIGCDAMREDGSIMMIAEGLDPEDEQQQQKTSTKFSPKFGRRKMESNPSFCSLRCLTSEMDDVVFDVDIPPSPKKFGAARMVIRRFSVFIDVLSPNSSRTRIVANVDPKFKHVPKRFINFLMKNIFGAMLVKLQAAAHKIKDDPINNVYAKRMRLDASFYRHWLLPKFKVYCDDIGWVVPNMSVFQVGSDADVVKEDDAQKYTTNSKTSDDRTYHETSDCSYMSQSKKDHHDDFKRSAYDSKKSMGTISDMLWKLLFMFLVYFVENPISNLRMITLNGTWGLLVMVVLIGIYAAIYVAVVLSILECAIVSVETLLRHGNIEETKSTSLFRHFMPTNSTFRAEGKLSRKAIVKYATWFVLVSFFYSLVCAKYQNACDDDRSNETHTKYISRTTSSTLVTTAEFFLTATDVVTKQPEGRTNNIKYMNSTTSWKYEAIMKTKLVLSNSAIFFASTIAIAGLLLGPKQHLHFTENKRQERFQQSYRVVSWKNNLPGEEYKPR